MTGTVGSPDGAPAAEAAPLRLRTKLAFGIGSAAETIALFSVISYALLFYNQVVGLPGWLGAALAGVILSIIAFPEKAQPGTVDPAIIDQLALFVGPVAMIPGIISVFFYARYRISQREHAATRARIAELHSARVAAPSAS